MGKLLEVIRRLAVALVWLIGGGSSIAIFLDYYDGHHKTGIRDPNQGYLALGILVGTFILHKVINWILLRDDKLFEND